MQREDIHCHELGKMKLGNYDPHFSSPSDLGISNMGIFVLNVLIRLFPNRLNKQDLQKYIRRSNMK